jgi:glyoxylase-like metal-dependent hydrolase (beta-lactamase superfamily II)/rhodanese-related sulfurtransferase
MQHPIVKAINCSGCQTYLVGCPETRRAALVDPKLGQEVVYRDLVERFGFELVATIDTHTHADHISASTRFTGSGVELWMSARSACRRPRRGLHEGDELELGFLRLRVLEVPGHTPDSLALHGPGFVLTGDSLLIDGLARADFRGSDPAQLFESVRTQLASLPDGTLVFPGHGYDDLLFSTIGAERELNPALRFESGAAYAASLDSREGAGNSPAVDETLRLNLEEDPQLPESPVSVATCCAAPSAGTARRSIPEVDPAERRVELEQAARDARWVDVREPWEFAHGRIPQTRSVPLSALGFHLAQLESPEPLTLSCRSGVRSMTAARTLERLGITARPFNLKGGILRWQELGYPIEGRPAS